MKKITILLLASFFSLITFAQSGKYHEAMRKSISILDTATQVKTLQKVSNQFERIAAAETTKIWPNYYVAYCNVRMALPLIGKEGAQMGAFADKAQAALDLALAIEPDNSELLALQGYILHIRVWGNPQMNGPKYAPQAQAVLEKAIALDDTNPRAYHLIGQNLFFTPAFWGGGAANAKPFLAKAEVRYANAKTTDNLAPSWGAKWNTDLLNRANKALEDEKG